MRKILALVFAAMVAVSLSGCGSPAPSPTPSATQAPSPTAEPTQAPETPSPTPEETPTPTPTEAETPTAEPSPTTEAVDSAGSGSLTFDIYQTGVQRDVNFDDTAEDIAFTAGADKSVLEINGTPYDVPKPHLAQLFAITDIDTTDKYMEFVFTDEYDSDLADSEKAFSWLYWWNGSKLMLMGGLMDVKFAGEWRSSFKAEDVVTGKGQVSCLTNTTDLTDIWYVADYRPAGSGRKLSEWRHTATPLGDKIVLTCKTVCLLQSNHDETSRDNNKYMTSEYDYYWITNLSPTTLGRVPDPAPGIKLIAQPDDKLTILGTYGKTWFKVKTQDGIVGWIYCKGKHVGAYYQAMGWTAEDMFDGLTNAG